MSSILKALKRLERDKVRRQDDNVDLARDILHGDGRRLGPPAWLLPLLAVVGVLLGVTLLVLIWPREPAPLAPPVAAPLPAPTAQDPAAAEPAIVEELIDRRRPVSATATPAVVRTAPPGPAPASSGQKAPAAAVTPPPVALAPPPQATAAPAAPVPPATSASEAGADAVLAVSAIVFSDDPASRLAVVNDLPVMEGTLIGDVRVEEIRSDRVVFSRAGLRFAVPFEPSSP